MNIIVTGASRGIGFDLALKFASDPGNSVLVISRNEKRLKELQERCKKNQPESRLIILVFDLEVLESSESVLYDKILEHFSSVDIIVNNAGLLIKKSS